MCAATRAETDPLLSDEQKQYGTRNYNFRDLLGICILKLQAAAFKPKSINKDGFFAFIIDQWNDYDSWPFGLGPCHEILLTKIVTMFNKIGAQEKIEMLQMDIKKYKEKGMRIKLLEKLRFIVQNASPVLLSDPELKLNNADGGKLESVRPVNGGSGQGEVSSSPTIQVVDQYLADVQSVKKL